MPPSASSCLRSDQSKSSRSSGRHIRRAISLLPCIELIAAAAIVTVAVRHGPRDSQCFAKTFPWSPATSAVDLEWKSFPNVDFFNVPPTYLGLNQTDEREEAWRELLPKHPISIPSSRLTTLGHGMSIEKDDWIRDPGDPESLLALPEVFVQLGCINLIRQMAYSRERDYTHLPSFQGDRDALLLRAYQCLERLRQSVMCWADPSPIFQEMNPHPRPGQGENATIIRMDTFHRCKNFDKIKEWMHGNQLKHVEMDDLWWGGVKMV